VSRAPAQPNRAGRLRAILVLAAGLAGVAPLAHATTGGADPASRLAAAAAAHPGDPDLGWAHLRSLLEDGQNDAALAALRAFEVRFPGRRPEAARLEGRLLLETGDAAAAERALAAALGRDPDDALAWLWHGLALRRLGRHDEAARALERAGKLEPALRAESLALRGMDRLAGGDREGGRRLLEDAARVGLVTTAPDRTARPAASSRAPLLELSARTGVELDSNVTLDPGLDLPTLAGDAEDVRILWGGGATWRPLRGERLGLALGYRYDQTRHDELEAYDLESHAGIASVTWRATERMALRFDGRFADLALDGEGYLESSLVQPNVFLGLGSRAGLLRGFARFERQRFDEEPVLSSLERDAEVLGGGLGHSLPLPFLRPGAWLDLEGSFDRTQSEASRDLFGLAGAYDHDRFRGALELGVPLPLRITARLGGSAARERYAYRSVVDLLTDDGVGTADPGRRRDTVLEGRLGLERPVGRGIAVELAWRGTRRVSSVDLYDYDRSVVGLYLHASTR
jgi:Flp pilus assembly protein TadD